jgi:hypothetical protein
MLTSSSDGACALGGTTAGDRQSYGSCRGPASVTRSAPSAATSALTHAPAPHAYHASSYAMKPDPSSSRTASRGRLPRTVPPNDWRSCKLSKAAPVVPALNRVTSTLRAAAAGVSIVPSVVLRFHERRNEPVRPLSLRMLYRLVPQPSSGISCRRPAPRRNVPAPPADDSGGDQSIHGTGVGPVVSNTPRVPSDDSNTAAAFNPGARVL